jgi:hypothetical protein
MDLELKNLKIYIKDIPVSIIENYLTESYLQTGLTDHINLYDTLNSLDSSNILSNTGYYNEYERLLTDSLVYKYLGDELLNPSIIDDIRIMEMKNLGFLKILNDFQLDKDISKLSEFVNVDKNPILYVNLKPSQIIQDIRVQNKIDKEGLIDLGFTINDESSDLLLNIKKFLNLEEMPTFRENTIKIILQIYDKLLDGTKIPQVDFMQDLDSEIIMDLIEKKNIDIIDKFYRDLIEVLILKYKNVEIVDLDFYNEKSLKNLIMDKYYEGYNERIIKEDVTPPTEVLKKLSSVLNIRFFIESNDLMSDFNIINRE